jgi:hypothetical protein
MIWGWLIPGWLRRAALALGALALAVLGAFAAGKREARRDADRKNLEADRDANRRMDGADVSRGNADHDREWLRERSDE